MCMCHILIRPTRMINFQFIHLALHTKDVRLQEQPKACINRINPIQNPTTTARTNDNKHYQRCTLR